MNNNNVTVNIKNLSKSFKDILALKDINLEISAGQVLSILGPNGAGKTTLINIMLGRLSATKGMVEIFSTKPGDIAVKRLSGAMLQVASLPDTLTVKEHIELFQSYYPNPFKYLYLIDLVGLKEIENKRSKNLSGGQKQKLLFALSICGNPKLLFLDEPSVGLDINARKALWKVIDELKNNGTAIVLTTHYLEEADYLSDEIVMINKGKIVQRGTPEDIKQSVNLKKITFKSAIPITSLNGFKAVQNVEKVGNYYQLTTINSVESLKSIFEVLKDISDLTVSAAMLEDAFIKVNEELESNSIAA
jgi:ABC-2 type transport system ATP-binding protein